VLYPRQPRLVGGGEGVNPDPAKPRQV